MNYKINSIVKSLGLFAVIILLNSSGLYAQQSKWEKLGSRKVNFTLDKDVIQLGAKEGAFSKLMIKVTGGAINMHRMIIHYGNGGKEERPLKHSFSKGRNSRMIDIKGKMRLIKNVTFWYDSKNKQGQKATLHLLGKH